MMYAPAYYHSPGPSGYSTHHPESPPNPDHSVNPEPVNINQPIYFSSGQFSGQTMRYELKELQKADLGRKYARVDRRPLDPPPVVLLRIYRVLPDTGAEEEVNYEDVQTHGLLCTVDLFPVPAKTPQTSQSNAPTSPRASTTTQSGDGFVHFNPAGPSSLPVLTPSPPYRPQAYGPSDIVHYYNGTYALLESSKNTHCLVGATFVQPVFIEISGRKCIVFVFSDLAVKTEGSFTLRYRVFDLFSRSADPYSASPPPPTVYSASPAHSISPTLSNITSSSPSPASPPRQPPMNPYPDPRHGYAPPPIQISTPLPRSSQGEEIADLQAQFAPRNLHPRIEPHDFNSTLNIFAECWASGAFRVYSTKEFPGLPASTELTKHLARWGVRLNIRETERRRRRRSMMDDEEDYEFDGSDILDAPGTREQHQLPQRRESSTKPKALQQPVQQLQPWAAQRSPKKGKHKQAQARRHEDEEDDNEGEDRGVHEGDSERGQEDSSQSASGSGLPGFSTVEYFDAPHGAGATASQVQGHDQAGYAMHQPHLQGRTHAGARLPIMSMFSPHPPGGIAGAVDSRESLINAQGKKKRQSGDSPGGMGAKMTTGGGYGSSENQGGSSSVGAGGPFMFSYNMNLFGSQG